MRITVWSLCFVMATIQYSFATPIEWSVADGGNGHSYEAVLIPGDITWPESRILAELAGGYLATVTSEAENHFVFSLVKDRPEFWWCQGGPWISGPWLGGYQDRNAADYSEPEGGWKWVSGEAWSYTNWMQGEPSGIDQDYLHFAGYDLMVAPTWDDAGASYYAQPYRGYVVEWTSVPEPSSIVTLLCGLTGMSGMLWRRRNI